MSEIIYAVILEAANKPFQLGVGAAFLQVGGYLLYIRQSVRNELDPNPATWLMFAYGTTLLTILELDLGAGFELLFLPVTCSVLGVYVAYLCWKKGTLGWPKHSADRTAFGADIVLTFGYIGAWWLSLSGSISDDMRGASTLAFLIFSNLTTVTAFAPLLRDAYLNPKNERSQAWVVWTGAYVLLAIATFQTHGMVTPLMVYPVTSAVLHGLVAWLARPSRRRLRRNMT